MPLLKNILKTLAKSVLIPLGLVIQKKILEPGVTTLIIWNDELNDLKINILKNLVYQQNALVK